MVVVAQRVVEPPQVLSDHELVARSRCGSDAAFAELYRRYATRVCGFVAGFIGDRARAEDLTQEIFLSAVRRLRVTEEPITFKPWVFEIARNASIDELRRQRRNPEVAIEAAALEQTLPWVAQAPPLDVVVAGREQLNDLRGAFHGLSRTHHQLLVLREFEGRSYDEIGSRLGMSRPMVESGLFRARRKLNHEFDELTSGRRCELVKTVIADSGNGRLGLRQGRQVAHHLAHCEPCRRAARAAGLDEHWLRPPRLTGRIAALLPLPWLRWRAGRVSGSSPSVTNSLTTLADPSGPLHGLASVAAAAAAVLAAGMGGGLLGAPAHAARPATHRVAPAAVASTPVGAAPRLPATTSASAAQVRPPTGRRPSGGVPAPGRATPATAQLALSRTPAPGRPAAVVARPAAASAHPSTPAALSVVPDVSGVTHTGAAGGALAAAGATLAPTGPATGQLVNTAQRGLAGAVNTTDGAVAATAGTAVDDVRALGAAAGRAVRAAGPVAH